MDQIDRLFSLSETYFNISKGEQLTDAAEDTLKLLEELMSELTENIASRKELFYGERQS